MPVDSPAHFPNDRQPEELSPAVIDEGEVVVEEIGGLNPRRRCDTVASGLSDTFFTARGDEQEVAFNQDKSMDPRNPFRDNSASQTAGCLPSNSVAPSKRSPGDGAAATKRPDGAADTEDEAHFHLGYRFPSRSTYQPLPLASSSRFALPLETEPPSPSDPLDAKEFDPGIDIDGPTIASGMAHQETTEDSKAVPGLQEWDGREKRGGLAPEGKKAGLEKLTVTMKSPTSTDFRTVTPAPYTPATPYHTRDDSEPSSALRSGLSTPGGSDGEPSDDDYDWSGEEDLADQQAKYSEQMGHKKKKAGWGVRRVLSLLFSTLIGSTFLSGLLVTPPLIVHFYWYKANPTPERRYIDKNIQAWLFWVASNVTISWFLAMIIDVIPLLVQYLLLAIWGHVSEAFKSRLEMYAAVKDTAKPAFYAASVLASWVIIFGHIYGLYSLDPEVDSAVPYTDRLYQVVLFFFFFILVVCVQQMLSHFIAYNFHQTAYKERLEGVQKSLSVIEVLQNYRPKTHRRTGTQTPAGAFLFDGKHMTEKDHYSKLNSALKSVADHRRAHPTASNAASRPLGSHNDEDTEDWDKTLVDGSKKRRSALWPPEPTNPFAEQHRKANVEDEMVDIPLQPRDPPTRPSLPERPSAVRLATFPSHRPTPSAVSFSNTAEHSPDAADRHMRPSHLRNNTGTSDIDGKVVQAAKVIKKAVLHDARNIQGNDTDFLSWNVNSTTEAKRLARSIFRRLKDRHRKYLIAADFYPAFPTHEEAEEAFRTFDKDNNGDLSRAEIKIKLVKTYQERRFLSRSLKDTGEALKTLNRILLVFAMIIVGFISLSVFGVDVGDSLTSMYSLAIAASFIFKSSASRAFDAIMFLFVTHPYDTGDRIFIDSENLVVKKVGLFATVFARSDGTETYYFNSQLFNKFITNARRSDKTTEMLNLSVGWKTPLTKLDALERYLNDWLSTEEHRWYQPNTGVTLQHIQYQRYLTLTIGIPHNGNWQDWGLRNMRRTAFHAAVQYYCRQLGISGYEAPMPIVFSDQEANSTSRSDTLANDGEVVVEPPAVPIDEIPADEATLPNDQRRSVYQGNAAQPNAGDVKPSLGFLPPLEFRSSHSARARKSHRSRKEKLGAMNAEC